MKERVGWNGFVALVLVVAVAASGCGGGSGSASNGVDGARRDDFNFDQCMSDEMRTGQDEETARNICHTRMVGGVVTTQPSGTLPPNIEMNAMNADSLDEKIKGNALGNGQCSGTGNVPLTHAPMNIADVRTIQPMGLMLANHVTPVDHQYYYQVNERAPKDTYPVFSTADGVIVGVQHTENAWFVILSHSCTFFTQYNLITGFEPSLEKQLPAGWGPNSNGGVKIPVKSGQIIGYVGGQSLDFSVWNTETTAPGLLHRTAYNLEPWKVNTVAPLEHFTDAVKAEVLTRYVRTAEPRDGKFDHDVAG